MNLVASSEMWFVSLCQSRCIFPRKIKACAWIHVSALETSLCHFKLGWSMVGTSPWYGDGIYNTLICFQDIKHAERSLPDRSSTVYSRRPCDLHVPLHFPRNQAVGGRSVWRWYQRPRQHVSNVQWAMCKWHWNRGEGGGGGVYPQSLPLTCLPATWPCPALELPPNAIKRSSTREAWVNLTQSTWANFPAVQRQSVSPASICQGTRAAWFTCGPGQLLRQA